MLLAILIILVVLALMAVGILTCCCKRRYLCSRCRSQPLAVFLFICLLLLCLPCRARSCLGSCCGSLCCCVRGMYWSSSCCCFGPAVWKWLLLCLCYPPNRGLVHGLVLAFLLLLLSCSVGFSFFSSCLMPLLFL